ncbi:hypothetical protein GUJ93_ZPchr0006g46213 [Zizania palustris]|uniref:Uncharacterized protein n=1 Tax=Zizania palustris TaxID=103762 RepID=A0A8J5SVP7_ZIZPA|nr:hypothetical protein GUJ93_ZPchr0006g46213 [Zizania palustris]
MGREAAKRLVASRRRGCGRHRRQRRDGSAGGFGASGSSAGGFDARGFGVSGNSVGSFYAGGFGSGGFGAGNEIREEAREGAGSWMGRRRVIDGRAMAVVETASARATRFVRRRMRGPAVGWGDGGGGDCMLNFFPIISLQNRRSDLI